MVTMYHFATMRIYNVVLLSSQNLYQWLNPKQFAKKMVFSLLTGKRQGLSHYLILLFPFITPNNILNALGWCCALCPFGSTCQRFGVIWDGGDLVELTNYISSVYMLTFCEFCNLFIE